MPGAAYVAAYLRVHFTIFNYLRLNEVYRCGTNIIKLGLPNFITSHHKTQVIFNHEYIYKNCS
jgi:hypothetical protein